MRSSFAVYGATEPSTTAGSAQCGADPLGDRAPGDVERLGAAQRAAEDERSLERAEHLDGQRARLGDAGLGEGGGEALEPQLEDLGAGLAQRLAGRRRLERDGRDRARVLVARVP